MLSTNMHMVVGAVAGAVMFLQSNPSDLGRQLERNMDFKAKWLNPFNIYYLRQEIQFDNKFEQAKK